MRSIFKIIPIFILFLPSFLVFGQNDCSSAEVVCNNGQISYNPIGPGIDDFADPDNQNGCLSTEHQSAWYYFEFDNTMPPNSSIEFDIIPNSSSDYDFAIYGPDVDCGNLGSPIRCSWAASSGTTGLGNGATDTSEGAGGDDYVAAMTVQPGEGYYLIVDNFSSSSVGFDLNWGGSASNYLDCDATPCDISVTSGADLDVCEQVNPFTLLMIITGTMGAETYSWTATNGGTAYLSSTTVPNPTLTLPAGVSGSFTFTLTVSEDACSESADITVNVTALPTPVITGPTSLCSGEPGILDAGSGYSSYLWSTNATTQTISVTSSGTYSVTVEQGPSCSGTASFTVDVSPGLSPQISGDDTVCDGGSASIGVTENFSSYLWSTNEITQQITVTSAGTYSVTVEDPSGCTGMASFVVSLENIPPPVISGDLSLCADGGSTVLSVLDNYKSYLWSTNQNTQDITVTTAGTYSVTVSDSNGCLAENSVIVTEDPNPAPVITGDLEVCLGSTTILDAGPGYASYLWDTNETSQTINASPGSHSVTVTDGLTGCKGSASVQVIGLELPQPGIYGDLVLCPGESIQLSTDPDYVGYSWSTGDLTQNATVFAPGPVSVTVTDENGCKGQNEVLVLAGESPFPVISGEAILCPGQVGTLDVGSGYASYNWSVPGNFSQFLNINSPGTYSVTVTSNDGCEGFASFDVAQGAIPDVQISGNLSFCQFGQTILDAGPGYASYTWSPNGEVNQQIMVNQAGSYSVEVSNADGCTNSASVFVDQFPNPQVFITGTTEICPGGSTILGVNAPYATYLWSDNSFGPTLQVIAPGFYGVTITDFNGCEGTASVFVSQSPDLQPFISGPDQICLGGTAVLDAGPGYASYQWSIPGQFTQFLSINAPGIYSVQVTDANGCQGVTEHMVTFFPENVPVITGDLSICPGQTTFLGLESTYLYYTWSDNSTGPFIEVGEAGLYGVTVEDFNGCLSSASVFVEQAPPPQVQISGDSQFCEGSSTVLDAGPGYLSYLWSDNSISQLVNVYEGGLYSVTVSNDQGCLGEASLFVEEYSGVDVEISGSLSFCPGSSTILDAGPGYSSYLWSDSSNGQTFSAVSPGNYSVTVTDANSCVATDMVTVIEQNELSPVISGDLSICIGENTILDAGSSYLTYLWSNGSEEQAITVDSSGNYSLTVTDGFGCSGETAVFVQVNPLPEPIISGVLEICQGDSTILDAGSGFADYNWSTLDSEQTIVVDAAGNYTVTITDNNACSASTMEVVVVNELPEPQISGLLSFCPEGSTSLSVDDIYSSFLWSNNEETSSVSISTPGTYSLTVTDEHACQGVDSVEVEEIEVLIPQLSGDYEFCEGTSTVLMAESGYESYLWSNGVEGDTVEVSEGGIFSLSVVDGNGCEGYAEVEIIENPLPEVQIDGPSFFCEGSFATLMVDSIFESYSWSSGSLSPVAEIFSSGMVSLMAVDSNGCENTATLQVDEIPEPDPQISGDLAFCPETSTLIAVQDGFVSYEWNEGTFNPELVVSNPGEYSILVEDNFGCLGTDTVTIDEFQTMIPQINGPTQFCPGDSILLSVEPDFQSYQWIGGVSEQTLLVDQVGDYSVTVTDDNGCQTEHSVSISEYDTVLPVIDGFSAFCSGQFVVLSVSGNFDSYYWSTGDETQSIEVFDGQFIELSVVDSNACTTSASLDVVEHALPVPQIGGSTSFCTGSFTTLNAGAVYQSYLWSDNSSDPSLQVQSPGIYSLTVTNEFACMDSTSVEVTEDSELSPLISGALEYCTDSSTLLDAGEGFATYLWSDNSSGQMLSVDEPGIYGLTVTDESGCFGEAEVLIVENPLPVPEIQGASGFCEGASLVLDAGPDYMTYSWSVSGNSGQELTVDQAGNYSLTVTDSNGCENVDNHQVEEWPLPIFEISGQLYFCEGSETTLDVTVGFDEYSWSNANFGHSIIANESDTYIVTVTNTFACQSEASVFVEEISLPIAEAGEAQLLDCDDLSVNLGADGTSQGIPFVYEWQGPGINAQNKNDLYPEVSIAGEYELIVLDTQYNCVSNPSMVSLTDLSYEPVVFLEVLDELDCITEAVVIDGSLSESGSNIIYEWYDQSGQIHEASGNTYLASSAQVYSLLLIDTLTACAAMDSIEVFEHTDYPIAEAGNALHLDCNILSLELDGSASQSGLGIEYQWDTGDGHIIGDPNGVLSLVDEPGIYFLTVSDTANGCFNIDSVLVSQDILAPIADAGANQELDCHTESVILDGTGSSQGVQFIYQWSMEGDTSFHHFGSTPEIETPGLYGLQITNTTNGCSSEDQVLVELDEAAPTALDVEVESPTCFEDEDGVIYIQDVVGGTPPFMYSLDGEYYTSGAVFPNLPAGHYTVAIQDLNGCELFQEIFMEPGNDLELELGDDDFINLGEAANLTALINIPDEEILDFSWNEIHDFECIGCFHQAPQPLETTTYSASVEDVNGCVATDEVTIFVDRGKEVFVPNAFSPNNDGINDVLMVFAGLDVEYIPSFLVFNRWGEIVFQVYNFQPNMPEYGWQGTYRSVEYNAAVFTWFAEVKFIDGEVKMFKGDVTLIK